MAASILSRYLDADVLNHIAHRPLEPKGLVLGNLAGAHKSPLSGFAVEFAGHREYVPGDDPKHIDWRVYYSREKYFVKQYELETNFVCHLLLDVSASMRYGEGVEQKLLYAGQAALALGYSIVRQSDKVALFTFHDQVCGHVLPSNSLAQIVRLTEHLEAIRPERKTAMHDCLAEIAGRVGRREIVFIFSDFFTNLDALEPVLQQFRYGHHEVVLFEVLHPDEIEFQLEGMLKFVALEGGEPLLAQSEDLKHSYLAALQRHQQRLDDMAHRNRCERVLLNTSHRLSDQLGDYLNRRLSLLGRR
jgi:uncharacterized protein (DUF58 family)